MIEARIGSNFPADGIDIWIGLKAEGARMILQPGPDGIGSWEILEPGVNPARPTMVLQDEAGRALLDALLRHYEGASDMRTVRSDLLHERGRVDKLTDALIRLTDAAVQG